MKYPTDLTGIEIGGIYIHEPGGLLSNVAVCVLSFLIVLSIGKTQNAFQKNWKAFILCIGIGAFGGSFTHGFPTYLGEHLFFWVWAVKNSFVPLANYFASKDVLPNLKWIRIILIAKMFAIILALFITGKFLPAVIDLSITYILVIIFANRLIRPSNSYSIIRNAFILALLSGTLFIIKYDVNELWFTHKDMVHVFIIISLIMIFRAIKKSKNLETL